MKLDIERLAREAGLDRFPADHICREPYYHAVTQDELQAFATLVLEEAAKMVEVQRNDIPACGFEFAAVIRALKGQP
jgi:hypothetical protein